MPDSTCQGHPATEISPINTILMNKSIFAFVAVTVMLLGGCAGRGGNTSGTDASRDAGGEVAEAAEAAIPVIDLTRRYPEKTVELGEIADIRYVPLETTEKSLIGSVGSIAMRDNRIIIFDFIERKVLIFDGDGHYLRRVSAFGPGPREYLNPHHCAVDFDNELIYIFDFGWPRSTLKVFDFDGYWVRKVDLAEIPGFDKMYLFDKDRLIVRCDPNKRLNDPEKIGNNPYWFIDVNTGETCKVPVEFDGKAFGADHNVVASNDQGYISASSIGLQSTHKYDNQVIISEYTDMTAYRGADGGLQPLVRLIQPKNNDQNQQILTSIAFMTDRFIVFDTVKRRVERQSGKMELLDRHYLMYDRADNSVADVDIRDIDIDGSTMLNSWGNDMPRNTLVSQWPVESLQMLLDRGKLKGPLKELADTIDEDANPVLAVITFK